jgi:hypothetical protein
LVPRHELVANRIAQQAGGLPFLVTLRADLLAALSGQLELGEFDDIGGDGDGGGVGSVGGSGGVTGDGSGDGTEVSGGGAGDDTEVAGGGAGAATGRDARLEGDQAEIEGDRAELVARSELAAATRAQWRLLDDSLRRVLVPW